jgi:hypothetical protein
MEPGAKAPPSSGVDNLYLDVESDDPQLVGLAGGGAGVGAGVDVDVGAGKAEEAEDLWKELGMAPPTKPAVKAPSWMSEVKAKRGDDDAGEGIGRTTAVAAATADDDLGAGYLGIEPTDTAGGDDTSSSGTSEEEEESEYEDDLLPRWQYNGIKRTAAGDLVMAGERAQAGTFLVRGFEGNDDKYWIVVQYKGKATHHIVERPAPGGNLKLNKKEFGPYTKIAELIAALATTKPGWPVPLIDPVLRPLPAKKAKKAKTPKKPKKQKTAEKLAHPLPSQSKSEPHHQPSGLATDVPMRHAPAHGGAPRPVSKRWSRKSHVEGEPGSVDAAGGGRPRSISSAGDFCATWHDVTFFLLFGAT